MHDDVHAISQTMHHIKGESKAPRRCPHTIWGLALGSFLGVVLGVALGLAWVRLALLATALACVVGLAASGIDVFAARGSGWPA